MGSRFFNKGFNTSYIYQLYHSIIPLNMFPEKLILFGFLLICITATPALSQPVPAISWEPCTKDGFGHPEEISGSVDTLGIFKGYLYVGRNKQGTLATGNGVKVFRTLLSSDCTAWEPVVGDSASTPVDFGSHSLSTFHDFVVFNYQLYCAVSESIFRTSDGINWEGVVADGALMPRAFGDSGTWDISNIAVFKGYIYAMTFYISGGQVWRSADGTTWEQVVGDAAVVPNGFGDSRNKNLNTDMVVLKDYLYCSVDGGLFPDIFRTSDGINWELAASIGVMPESVSEEMIVFENMLYATTRTGSPGSQRLWRSDNGVDWIECGPSGLVSMGRISTLASDSKYIYFSFHHQILAGCIYRSENGLDWNRIAEKGFYDTAVEGRNDYFLAMISKNGSLYAGTYAYKGYQCQVWRTDNPVTVPVSSSSSGYYILAPVIAFLVLVSFLIQGPQFSSKLL